MRPDCGVLCRSLPEFAGGLPAALLAFAAADCYPATCEALCGLMPKLMSIAAVMKSITIPSLLALVLSASVSSMPAQNGGKAANASTKSQRAGSQAAGPVVGVIDVGAIVDQYPVFIQMRADLDKRFGQFNEQLKASTEKLEQMRMTLQTMGEDAPQRADFEHQYKMALQNHDYQRKSANDQLANEELRMMLLIYEDLDFAVSKVAKKRGVTLVVPKRDIPMSATPVKDMKIREVEDRVGAFQRRTVWYAAKEVDMTGAVIKYMQDPLPARTSPERAPKQSPTGSAGAGKPTKAGG